MKVKTVEMTPEVLLRQYKEQIEAALFQEAHKGQAAGLYEPIEYLLKLGGKRLRPAMVLAACAAVKGDVEKAIPAALAVEVFHNFSLMHDDIMDEAPLRRGQQTVHEKWDSNTAILSGDAMLVQAYQHLAKCESKNLPQLLELFNATALEVCEGQQLDMEFEQRSDVTIDGYLEMIRLKTSVLLACSIQIGLLIAGASDEQQKRGYQFGLEAGLAFQLQDDYLDAFGDPEHFGKQIGGDILCDKKTFLYLTCMAKANHSQLAQLDAWIGNSSDPATKVAEVKGLFIATGAEEELREQMQFHYEKALEALDGLELEGEGRALFNYLAELVHMRQT
ncbi:MAG: geranylgeranyl diphosphate synthase type II [Flavobacteriales bacterium]